MPFESAPLAIGNSLASRPAQNALTVSGQGGEQASADADPVSRLRKMITERETETIQILQDWMEQPEETEGV